jgi:acyl transferase domain-containing protein/NADPH:quinone reductase-like Zn-dependent oxidoreductase/SAM-dependent methyltransferase
MVCFPKDGPKRVSINSFGYGGTNAHVVMEAPDESLQALLAEPSKLKADTAVNGNGVSVNGNGFHNHDSGLPSSNGDSETESLQKPSSASATNGTNRRHGSESEYVLVDNAANGTNGVNSKATKGTHAHVEPELFILSARSESSLQVMIENLQKWVSQQNDGSSYFHDLAHTLSSRRTLMSFRFSTAAATHAEFIHSLNQVPRITKATTNFRSVFLFTGQGAQWNAMGKELTISQPIFRESMLKSDDILRMFGANWSLINELSNDAKSSRIGQAEISQPSTTAIQIALVDLLRSFGVLPEIVLGHSSGEIAAAYAAGILDHSTALEISYHRGFISQTVKASKKGAMLAVGLGEDDVLPYIDETRTGLITVACVNSPVSTTISGDESAIDELRDILDESGIFNRKLNVDTAYHSHHMKRASSEYLRSISHIKAQRPSSSVKFYSSVISAEKTTGFDAQYWVDNLVSKVRFGNALELICRTELLNSSEGAAGPLNLFLEIGPHSALAGPIRQVIKALELSTFKYNYVPTLIRDRNAVVASLEFAGKLWEVGYPLSLQAAMTNNDEAKTPETISDLAPYPWDHSSSYWYESNMSKQYRLRAHPPHDLLGLRVIGTTNHEPTWRNLVGIDTLPWLRDHVVDGFIIYPGAGYICMVIEAVRQISLDRQIPGVMSRILFKNVAFSKAIIIPEQRQDGLTPDVEMMLTLRPERSLTDRTWESFRILALSAESDVWNEHCSGSVMIEWTPKMDDEVEGLREDEMNTLDQLHKLQTIRDACDMQYSGEEFYKTFAANGNVFGPTFTNVQVAQIGDQGAVCDVLLPDASSVMPSKFLQPHLIHPASFDAISHLGMPMYRRSGGKGPVMPTGMDEVIINCKIGNKPGTKWIVAASMTSEGPRSATTNTIVFEETEDGSLIPIVDIKGGTLRGIGEAPSDEDNQPFHRKMTYQIKWKPDIEFMSKEAIESVSAANSSATAKQENSDHPTESLSTTEEMSLYEVAASLYIHNCLLAGQPTEEAITKPHLRKLLTWMNKYTNSETSKRLIGSLSEKEVEVVFQRTREAGVEGQMLARIGENLPGILAGEVDSLSVMLEDDLLSRFYSMGLIVPNYHQMAEYLKLLAFKHPHQRILEIGAGTGGATLPLIRALDCEEGQLFDRYHYTDISAGFFEQGKALLQEWIGRIDFKTLDISKDPIQQGFQEGGYDLIIASNVLHATTSLDETVANCRTLLKPGGRLILIELTRLTAHINTIFGTLSGWWAFEDGREDCPLLSTSQWNATLKRHGFNGLEVDSPDHQGPTARSCMMVSKAAESQNSLPTDFPSIEVICHSKSAGYQHLISEMSTSLTAVGFPLSVESWSSKPVTPSSIYIVLDDVNHPLLVEPAEERYQQIVSLVTKAKHVLWVSCQESSSELRNPVKGLVTGLARVVRRENEGMRFVTLDVQQRINNPGTLVSVLSEILTRSFPTPIQAPQSEEDEFSFGKDELLIPRISADGKFDDWVKRSVSTQGLDTGLFQQPQRPLKLEVETPGLLSSLRFVDDDLPSKEMGPMDLELEAKAHGINFKDVFIAMGQMVPGVTMAGECSGIVRKVGSALTDKFTIGDRVCGIGAEPFSSHPRINGFFSYQIPDAMSYAVGASIPVIFTTAYYCIVEVARLQVGQTVLIHAASGGVGQAAIQLAQNIGAEIFCTVGNNAKRQLLIDNFNIPPSHIFSSRLRTFKQGVLRLTNNKGVDCVLNSLSGEWLHDSFAVLAPLGTFVEIGKTDIYRKNQINMATFDKNVTFAAVDLSKCLLHTLDVFADLKKNVSS